ncbi:MULTISPECIES: ankyrin repeat domain-containing protein [Cupriavidus]
MTTETFQRTYPIPVENLARVRHTIERINKRAKKLGMPPVSLTVSEPKLARVTRVALVDGRNEANEIETSVADVTIAGEQPVLGGYAILAKLDFSAGTAPIVLGMDVPATYTQCAPDCDHCRKTRDRHTTYVLREIESGRHLQVGSTCMTDFFNGDDPFAKTAYLQLLYEIHDDLSDCEEYTGGIGGGVERIPAKAILEVACAEVRVNGYISKERGEQMLILSTADAVREHFVRKRPGSQLTEVLPGDCDKAGTILAWLGSDEMATERRRSTYLHNLSVLGGAEAIAPRHLGILASAVAAFDHRERRRLEAVDTRVSQYVGETDGKIERAVTILSKTLIPGNEYGDKMLYRMRDDDGNLLVWFCTGADIGEQGERLHISGTVKEHDTYRDVRQTTLLRVSAAENRLFDAIRDDRPASAILKLAAQPIEIDRLHHEQKISPLMAACRVGRTTVVQTLLDAGANPAITDRHGYTAAHYAAALGYANTLLALEDAGADLEAVAGDGQTPLSLLEADQTALRDDVRKFRTDAIDTDRHLWHRDAEFPVKGLLPKQETLNWFIEECARYEAEGKGDLRAVLAHQPYSFDVVIDIASGKPELLNGRRTIAFAMTEGHKTVTALVGLKAPEALKDVHPTLTHEGAPAPSSDQ